MINKKLLEFCMRNEEKIKHEVYLAMQDVKRDGGRKSGISRPTEAQALFHLTYTIEEILIDKYVVVPLPQKMLKLISYIKEHFNRFPEGEIYRQKYILKLRPADYYGNDRKRKNFYHRSVNKIVDYGLKKSREMGY